MTGWRRTGSSQSAVRLCNAAGKGGAGQVRVRRPLRKPRFSVSTYMLLTIRASARVIVGWQNIVVKDKLHEAKVT